MDKWYTQQCKFFLRNTCNKGTECTFLHEGPLGKISPSHWNPEKWEDEQGHVRLQTNVVLSNNLNFLPEYYAQEEAAPIKRGVKWVDHDGTTWRREFLTPEEAESWDEYFASWDEEPAEGICSYPSTATWTCVD
eukprot:10013296-Heterocapsa_arctica.AAC.1